MMHNYCRYLLLLVKHFRETRVLVHQEACREPALSLLCNNAVSSTVPLLRLASGATCLSVYLDVCMYTHIVTCIYIYGCVQILYTHLKTLKMPVPASYEPILSTWREHMMGFSGQTRYSQLVSALLWRLRACMSRCGKRKDLHSAALCHAPKPTLPGTAAGLVDYDCNSAGRHDQGQGRGPLGPRYGPS